MNQSNFVLQAQLNYKEMNLIFLFGDGVSPEKTMTGNCIIARSVEVNES
jgi:hypothetical protein